jgi:hypothetical protein
MCRAWPRIGRSFRLPQSRQWRRTRSGRGRTSTSLCARNALHRLIEVHATMRTIVDSRIVLRDCAAFGTQRGAAVGASGAPLHDHDECDRDESPADQDREQPSKWMVDKANRGPRTSDSRVQRSPGYALFHSFPHRHCGILHIRFLDSSRSHLSLWGRKGEFTCDVVAAR